MAPEQPTFQRVQYGFAGHIRDPEHKPAPGDVEDRRMAIYRRLFFNNVRTLLGWNLPRLRRLHSEKRWDALIRDFFSRHQSRTPYFPRIAEEFVEYLQNERGEREDDPPFMLELAHYEWMQKALSIADVDLEAVQADPEGDPIEGIPVVSPLAWPFSYRFPVHRIGPKSRPTEAPEDPTHVVLYRDRQDEIGHLQLNPVSARLLQLLRENVDHSARALLEQIAGELQHSKPEVVIEGGRSVMEEFARRDIVLGTMPGV